MKKSGDAQIGLAHHVGLKKFGRIALGNDAPAFQHMALLRDLPRQRPVIHTGTLQLGVQQQGMRDAPQVVFGQFDLYVLKERRP